jgi:hypothetical protein
MPMAHTWLIVYIQVLVLFRDLFSFYVPVEYIGSALDGEVEAIDLH